MKILLADDTLDTRKIHRLMMENMGYEVVEAANGQEAWESFDRQPVGVIVSDWMMPKVDGLSLCRHVRERPDTDYTYFILTSAQKIGKDNYRHAMSVGVDDFIGQPMDKEELYIRLQVAERIVSMTRRIRMLEGILPICMYCKRIRRQDDEYERVETYFQNRAPVKFSHGICPECMKQNFPEQAEG